MVGRARIVVEFTTTYVSAVYHHSRCEFESCSDEVYSIQYYVINLSVTFGRYVIFFGYSGFLQQ
jgi:hypothetical protein